MFSAQPVHDELEYIKMRYRSPARSSFRDQKAYETLTTRSTYTSSLDRTTENPEYSDNSTEHLAPNNKSTHNSRRHRPKNPSPHLTEIPWTANNISLSQPPQFTDIGGDFIDRYGNDGFPPPPPPNELHRDLGDPYSHYQYNIEGVQGTTVIWICWLFHQLRLVSDSSNILFKADASHLIVCDCAYFCPPLLLHEPYASFWETSTQGVFP